MNRIHCKSISWIPSSFRATAGCVLDYSRPSLVARNRIQSICTSRSCLSASAPESAPESAPASAPSSKKKSTLSTKKSRSKALAALLDSSALDSVSKNLINDLYARSSSTNSKITLDDILALRPAQRTLTPAEFDKFKDVVFSSFNVSQLKSVLRSQRVPASGKKAVLVNQVMVLMDLEVIVPTSNKSLVIEDPYMAIKGDVESEVIPSNRTELFFILGAEGDSLRQLEREKHVRISINIADETYTIRGVKESIEDAKEWIQERTAVTEEVWDVSPYNDRGQVMDDPSALEEIAKRSGTFVSSGDGNTLVIAGRSSRDMEEAKRLFDLKMHRFPDADTSPITTLSPVRSTPASVVTTDDLHQHLKDAFDSNQSPGQSLEFSAHFGQLLFCNKNPGMSNVPLSGAFDSLDLEEWLKTSDDPYFFPSLPFFKVISELDRVGPQRRTIEVEYIPSSRLSQSLGAQDPISLQPLCPIRIVLSVNEIGELCIDYGKVIEKQLQANIMMLSQATDIQIRGELSTKIEAESSPLKELLAQTTLPFSNSLLCPSFFSFQDVASAPAAAQLGLGSGSMHTHTLKSVLFKTTADFNSKNMKMTASDVRDQYGQTRRQELKLSSLLMPKPKKATEDALSTPSDTTSASASPLEAWSKFIDNSMRMNRKC
ncbi:hypothetical protein BG011_009554 [Mortierella polycephala]|uniref:SAP domain-containing protein n=1 Tax=Mortierella polycephala TaxID=41804 RepID=A0A9P6PMQ1_9FUNG|nr:hypothetical protein BG011_009554 [Mortierella polycephala]